VLVQRVEAERDQDLVIVRRHLPCQPDDTRHIGICGPDFCSPNDMQLARVSTQLVQHGVPVRPHLPRQLLRCSHQHVHLRAL
jgi:hypothetical protein